MGVIRQRRTVQLQNAGISRISTGAAEAQNAIAKAADNLTSIAADNMKRVAREKGIDYAEAVAAENLRAFDENGEPVALTVPQNFGTEAASVYREVIKRRYARQVDEDMREAGAQFAQKYKGSQEFSDQFSNYIASYTDGAQGRFAEQARAAGTAQLTSFLTYKKAEEQKAAVQLAKDESLMQAYNSLDNLAKIYQTSSFSEENIAIMRELEANAEISVANHFRLTGNISENRRLLKELSNMKASARVPHLISLSQKLSKSQTLAVEMAIRNPRNINYIESEAIRRKVSQIHRLAAPDKLGSYADMYRDEKAFLTEFSDLEFDAKNKKDFILLEEMLHKTHSQGELGKTTIDVANVIELQRSVFDSTPESLEKFESLALEQIIKSLSSDLRGLGAADADGLSSEAVDLLKTAILSEDFKGGTASIRNKLSKEFGEDIFKIIAELENTFTRSQREEIVSGLGTQLTGYTALSKIDSDEYTAKMEIASQELTVSVLAKLDYLTSTSAQGDTANRRKILEEVTKEIYNTLDERTGALVANTDLISKLSRATAAFPEDAKRKIAKSFEASFNEQQQNLIERVASYDGSGSPAILLNDLQRFQNMVSMNRPYFDPSKQRTFLGKINELRANIQKKNKSAVALTEQSEILSELSDIENKSLSTEESVNLRSVDALRNKIIKYSEKYPEHMGAATKEKHLAALNSYTQADVLGLAQQQFNAITGGNGMPLNAFNEFENYINAGKRDPYKNKPQLNELVNSLIEVKETPNMTTVFNAVMQDIRDQSTAASAEFSKKLDINNSIYNVENIGPVSDKADVERYVDAKLRPLVSNLPDGSPINFKDPSLYFDPTGKPTEFHDELMTMAGYGVLPEGFADMFNAAAMRGGVGLDGEILYSFFKSFTNSQNNLNRTNLLAIDGPNTLSANTKAVFGTAMMLYEAGFLDTPNDALAAVVDRYTDVTPEQILSNLKQKLEGTSLVDYINDAYEGADTTTINELKTVAMYMEPNITTGDDLKESLNRYLSSMYFPDERMLGAGGYGPKGNRYHKNSRIKRLGSVDQMDRMDKDIANEIISTFSSEEYRKYIQLEPKYKLPNNQVTIIDNLINTGVSIAAKMDGLNLTFGYEPDYSNPDKLYVKIKDETGAFRQHMISETITFTDERGDPITTITEFPMIVDLNDYLTPTPLVGFYYNQFRTYAANSPNGNYEGFLAEDPSDYKIVAAAKKLFRQEEKEYTDETMDAYEAHAFAMNPETIQDNRAEFDRLVKIGMIPKEHLPYFKPFME